MRNFGSLKTTLAEADARAACLSVAFGGGIDATAVRSGDRPFAANDNLVYFAGLALTGYSDTSGAPSANLPR
ncbi:hypothetical protein GA0061100_10816 [Rhizobium hainanense]|uniref:Uncharacterized protein n=1 Tax=Rhizobium hainanense TaxID=52131 RepID=A0A1C3VTZ6_9HYPH|nr:hypothetical protein GA0061100_10816 [Rhizobium hainanense]